MTNIQNFFEEGGTGGRGVEKNLNHSQINYQQGDGNKNAQHVGDGCVECGRLQEKLNVAQTQIEELKQDKMFLQELLKTKKE